MKAKFKCTSVMGDTPTHEQVILEGQDQAAGFTITIRAPADKGGYFYVEKLYSIEIINTEKPESADTSEWHEDEPATGKKKK